MEWAIEIALIFMLAATLFHALRLERALGVLKRDRAALEELVSSFNSSSRLAEQGIERLRAAADGAGQVISRQVDVAYRLRDDLQLLSGRGDQLADRLETLVKAGRNVGFDSFQEAGAPSQASARRVFEQVRRSAPTVPVDSDEALETEPELHPRLRSQAERDLLKALKLVR